MITEKIIKTKFYKSFTHSSINIDKVPVQIKITFDFFWDSINEKTILVLLVTYEDEFFTDLINNDFTENDKLTICKIFEDYLKQSLKGLELGYSFLLNTKLEKLSNYILYPKLLVSKALKLHGDSDSHLSKRFGYLLSTNILSGFISASGFLSHSQPSLPQISPF